MSTIRFYSKNEPFYEFSNFFNCKIIIDNKEWKSSEHYYQAQKFINEDHKEYIRLCDTPMKAFRIAKLKIGCGYSAKWMIDKKNTPILLNDVINKLLQENVKIRDDWEEIKIDVMKKVLYEKFTQHPNLMNILKNTNNSIIIEDSPRDSYWGIGFDKKGKNMLGKLLMELRNK